ncbi:Uncharacterized protein TCAP_03015 [Tolypocladium capitatum]|uniref:Uncharacterized protein n=1 Tax=Tolypocladium capitatum TaxID=45235 RepID=A0A2K3QHN5_9HYPO|nr:Uncharacterized protein TCAP_03015 [Tolypocladium capitatum]
MTLSLRPLPTTLADIYAMAPSTPAGIIYQALIQSNCQTFLGSDVDVDVVSQLDAAGTTWKVHVLKTEGGKRAAVLSGSAASLQGAFEDLHRKSAQAVDQYVSSNGFDAVPPEPLSLSLSSFTRRQSGRKGRGEGKGASSSSSPSPSSKFRPGSPASVRSVRTSSSSTGSEASGSESDDDGSLKAPSAGRKAPPPPQPQPSRRGKANKLPIIEVRDHGFATCRPLTLGGPGAHVHMPMPMPMPRPNAAVRPSPGPVPIRPPPTTYPGGWPVHGIAKTNWSMNNANTNNNRSRPPSMLAPGQQQQHPPPASGSGPTIHRPQPMPQPPATTAFKGSVMLTIHWAGHGEATFLDQCELGAAAIRNKVIDLLATRHAAFRSAPPWQRTPEALGNMDIEVRRVRVDQQTYFVGGGMQDDLSLLVSAGPAPRVVQVFVGVDDDGIIDD